MKKLFNIRLVKIALHIELAAQKRIEAIGQGLVAHALDHSPDTTLDDRVRKNRDHLLAGVEAGFGVPIGQSDRGGDPYKARVLVLESLNQGGRNFLAEADRMGGANQLASDLAAAIKGRLPDRGIENRRRGGE